MLAHDYSYRRCLDNSLKVYWDAERVLADDDFDFSRNFMPDAMVGASMLPFLDPDEGRVFNHINGLAYFHQAQFVEEPIIAMILEAARTGALGDEDRLRALLRFCEEEVKHQSLFQAACARIEEGIGASCGLVAGKEEVAQSVLGAPRLSAMLLADMVEWVTQAHYVQQFRGAEELDPLFSEILRLHWLEEAQHTKIDALLMQEMVEPTSLEEREAAVDGMLALCEAVAGLIHQQAVLNAESLGRATGRRFTEEEHGALVQVGEIGGRYGLLGLGLRQPGFVQLVEAFTEAGPAKVAAAAARYSPPDMG